MEETLFEVVTETTPASCKAVAMVQTGAHSEVLWLIDIAIAICTCILWFIRSHYAYWITVVLVFLLLQTVFHVPITGVLRYYVHKAEDRSIHIAFDATGIQLRTRAEDSKIPYADIVEWAKTRGFYVILLHNHTPIAIDKRVLPQDCEKRMEEILLEQTGKECRRVNA